MIEIKPATAASQRHYARICLQECRARRGSQYQHQRDFAETLLQWALEARVKAHAARQPKQLELFA